MKNILNYYYQLYPTNIHQSKKEFRFELDHTTYLLTPLMMDPKQLNSVYQTSNKMIQYQLPVHQIIPNMRNELTTPVNNIPYVLLKQQEQSKDQITLIDLLRFQEQTSFFVNHSEKLNWKPLWEQKVDYFEYQVNQFGKRYPLIRKSFSYYVGLAEMAITMLNFYTEESGNQQGQQYVAISHRRITEDFTYNDLYNSLDFITDTRVRDVAEYFKNKFFANYFIMDEVEDFLKSSLSTTELLLFFIRLLFPSCYFDCYEEIIAGNKDENEILHIIDKSKDYEEFLVEVYYIIQQYTRLPEIDWFKFYGNKQ